MKGTSRRRRAAIRVGAFIVVLVALWGLAQAIPLDDALSAVRSWAAQLGMWAPLAFVGGYVLATLLGVPGTPLTVIGALVFGPVDGLVVAIVGSTLTSVAAFWIARTVARGPLERWLARRPSYERMQNLLVRNDWTAIAFLRVQPLFPFTLVNYALGLSRVPFWKYLAASEIAMLPMNAVWVWSAASVYRIVLRGEIPWGLLGITLAAAVVLALLVRLGRSVVGALNGRNHEEAQQEGAPVG